MKDVGKLYIKSTKMPCNCKDCEFLAMFYNPNDIPLGMPKYGCVLVLDKNEEKGLKLISNIYERPRWCRLRCKPRIFKIQKFKRV